MNIAESKLLRIQFLVQIVQKEIRYLKLTDQRLFQKPFTEQQVTSMDEDIDLAEQVDAFVSRFGRLQDTVGDKLIPHYLNAVGENTGAAIDNLNRVEKLFLIQSAETWIMLRDMRNQMIHEYMEDPIILANALNKAHENVSQLLKDAENILGDIAKRGWVN